MVGRYNPELFESDRWDDALSDWERRRIEATLALIPEDAERVLDVGCGAGHLTHRVAARGHFTVGADYAAEGVARLKIPGVRASADALPFPDGAFDAVICSEVIEHLPSPLFEGALRELRRVARRWVILTVPYRERLAEARVCCPECGEVFNSHGHLRSFEPDEVRALLPRPDRVEVLIKPRAYQDPALLWLMQRGLGRYGYNTWAVCPACGNRDFEARKVDWVRRGVMGLNRVLHRNKVAEGGWILARFKTGGGQAPSGRSSAGTASSPLG